MNLGQADFFDESISDSTVAQSGHYIFVELWTHTYDTFLKYVNNIIMIINFCKLKS